MELGHGKKDLTGSSRADEGARDSPCSQNLECFKWAGIHSLFASAPVSGSRNVY